MPAVTDGEFRRRSWSAGVIDALDGFGLRQRGGARLPLRIGERRRRRLAIRGAPAEPRAAHRRRRLPLPRRARAQGPAEGHHRLAAGAPLLPRAAQLRPAAYADRDAYFADLVRIYRAEIAELAAAGCRYVQLDDTALACICDAAARAGVRARGEDPDALTAAYVALINAVLAGRPPEMFVGLHMCRGNFKGLWMAEGGYEAIAERVFGGLEVDLLLLEYDTPRAGDFSPLRFLPEGKTAALGLIGTKTPALEDKDAVKRRIDEAAAHAPLDRLAISPQCGFSSAGGAGQPVGPDDTRRKLELVLEIAEDVWGAPAA